MRVIGLVILALGLVLAPLAAEAQQAGNVRRIGLLHTQDGPNTDIFRQSLREVGYEEGRNLAYIDKILKGASGLPNFPCSSLQSSNSSSTCVRQGLSV